MTKDASHIEKIKTYISQTKKKKPPANGYEDAENLAREKRIAKDFRPFGREIPVESNGIVRNSRVQDSSPCGQTPNNRNRQYTCPDDWNKSKNYHQNSEYGHRKLSQTNKLPDCWKKSINYHQNSEYGQQKIAQTKTCTSAQTLHWKARQVKKTVDKLIDSFKTSCCGVCSKRATKIPCESYRDLLNYVRKREGLSNCACQQTDGDYERDLIAEIQRRMELGLCGNAPKPPPAIDFVEEPKKKKVPKKTPPSTPSSTPSPKKKKPPKIRKPIPPKPKPKPPDPTSCVYTPKVIDKTPPEAGTIQYRLSDWENITKGWTKLPRLLEDTQKTFYTLQAEPCGPLLDPRVWKKKRSLRYYPNGRTMARIEQDGRVEVYYQNCGGDLAIQVIPVGENHYRLVVFFNKDEHGRNTGEHMTRNDVPAAIFDSFGNGVVYDTKGKVRLVFDQAEGKLFDFPVRSQSTVEHPPLHWRWQNFQRIMQKRQYFNSKLACPNVKEEYLNLKHYLPRRRAPLQPTEGGTQNTGANSVKENSSQKYIDSKSVVSVLRRSKTKETVKSKSFIGLKIKKSKTKLVSGNSSERSPSTARSTNSLRSPQRLKKSRKHKEVNFEFCASDLELPDPLSKGVSCLKGVSNLETPIRLVMKIEKGVSLVIMDQCHIHLTFQDGRKHLIFNLGVHVNTDEPLQSKVTIDVDSPDVASLQDMFSIYAHTSTSLKNLLRPHNPTLEKQESFCEVGGKVGGAKRGGAKTCHHPMVRRQARGPCVRRRSQRIVKERMECDSYEAQQFASQRDVEKWMRFEMKKVVARLHL